MSENQKLSDEMRERRSNPTALGNIAYENIDTILAALRVSDQLPKTADGVPIVPGMEVWHTFDCGPETRKIRVIDVSEDQSNCEDTDIANGDWYDVLNCNTLYSTRAAALSALASPSSSAGEGGKA